MINSTTKHVYIFATHVTYSNYNAGALLSLSTIAARSTPSRRADFATMQLLRFLLEVFERLGVTVRFTSENVRSLQVAPARVARTRIDTLKSSGKAVLRWSQKVGAAKAFSRSYVSRNSSTRLSLPKYNASSSEELVEVFLLESQRAFTGGCMRSPRSCLAGYECEVYRYVRKDAVCDVPQTCNRSLFRSLSWFLTWVDGIRPGSCLARIKMPRPVSGRSNVVSA